MISVVVPVYNVEAYLNACVQSVLAQSYKNFELILVNDGSTDQSGGLCDRLAGTDPRIRVIHQANGGLGAARNTGLEAAKGEWLFFLDSDDCIEPEALALTLQAGERYGAELVIFGFRSVSESGKALQTFLDPLPMNQLLTTETHPALLLAAPVAWNKLYRRSLFLDHGIRYPGRVWYEDIRTTPKLLIESKAVVCIPEILHRYLLRAGSITKNVHADRNREILEAFEDLNGTFQRLGKWERYHKELEYLTVLHVFITASVRVLRIDPGHALLGQFSNYLTTVFPDYRKNPYLSGLGRNKRLILRLLAHRHYGLVRLIFQVKGSDT